MKNKKMWLLSTQKTDEDNVAILTFRIEGQNALSVKQLCAIEQLYENWNESKLTDDIKELFNKITDNGSCEMTEERFIYAVTEFLTSYKDDVIEFINTPIGIAENSPIEVGIPTKVDNPTKRILDAPAKYSLIDIFNELKWGRPKASQDYLDKCIMELTLEDVKSEDAITESENVFYRNYVDLVKQNPYEYVKWAKMVNSQLEPYSESTFKMLMAKNPEFRKKFEKVTTKDGNTIICGKDVPTNDYSETDCYVLTDRSTNGNLFVTLNREYADAIERSGNYLLEIGEFIENKDKPIGILNLIKNYCFDYICPTCPGYKECDKKCINECVSTRNLVGFGNWLLHNKINFKQDICEKQKLITFSEYIIQEKSEKFYYDSLIQMSKCNQTLEQWFSDMYVDYKIMYKL